MDHCRSAVQLKCTLRQTCRRHTSKIEKKQVFIEGDYWATECNYYLPEETADEALEKASEARKEWLRDNQLNRT